MNTLLGTETYAAALLFGGGDAHAIYNAPLPAATPRRTLALDGNAFDSGGSLWRTRSRRAGGGRQPHALLAVSGA